jgi:putative heme transporter
LATWTLVVSGIVSMSMLVVVGVAGAQLRGIGVLCSAVGALAAAVVLAGVTGTIASLAWSGRRIACFQQIANRLVDRALGVLGRHSWSRPHVAATEPIEVGMWQWWRACGLSAGNWLADVVAIAMTFLAVGLAAPWSRLLWAYVVMQFVVSIPVLGCIGVAESSMTLALVGIGVRPAPALAVVLVYRLFSFWLILPLGWVASRYLTRAESAGSQQDGRGDAWTAATPMPARASAVKARC